MVHMETNDKPSPQFRRGTEEPPLGVNSSHDGRAGNLPPNPTANSGGFRRRVEQMNNILNPGTMIKAGQRLMIPVGHVIGARQKAAAPAAPQAPATKAAPAAASNATAPAPRAADPAAQSVAGHAYKDVTNMVATAYGPA